MISIEAIRNNYEEDIKRLGAHKGILARWAARQGDPLRSWSQDRDRERERERDGGIGERYDCLQHRARGRRFLFLYIFPIFL